MVRITDRNDWFDLWFTDKTNMVNIMNRNMVADIEAGYDPMGSTIRREREEIASYKAMFDADMDAFKVLSDKEVNRWCFYDMKKRGVIE